MSNTDNIVTIQESGIFKGQYFITSKWGREGPYHYDGKWNPTMRRENGTYGYFENYQEAEKYCKDNNLAIVIGSYEIRLDKRLEKKEEERN